MLFEGQCCLGKERTIDMGPVWGACCVGGHWFDQGSPLLSFWGKPQDIDMGPMWGACCVGGHWFDQGSPFLSFWGKPQAIDMGPMFGDLLC